MGAELDYKQIIIDVSNRFNAIVNACMNSKDFNTIVGLTCASLYSGEDTMPYVVNQQPILDNFLCFNYKGYSFELSSCNDITSKASLLGITEDNFKERFPNGVFTDRYVCWMLGHKDIEGHTKEESDDPEYWSPSIYLVDGAWSWGAECDLVPGSKVDELILSAIDKFLETFKE